MTLPGILPPDAGRLERAARRYAIACLAGTNGLCALDALEEACSIDGLAGWDVLADILREAPTMEDPHTECRLLRARVALYLRWCERVERGDVWGWWDGWARYTGGVPVPWHSRNELLAHDVRWAVPLWTLAPAHDPAIRLAMRREMRRKS